MKMKGTDVGYCASSKASLRLGRREKDPRNRLHTKVKKSSRLEKRRKEMHAEPKLVKRGTFGGCIRPV